MALQYHEVKMYLSLRPFNECWEKPIENLNVQKGSNDKELLIISEDSEYNESNILGKKDLKLTWQDGDEQGIDKIENNIILLKEPAKSFTETIYIEYDRPDKEYNLDDIRLYCDYVYLYFALE